ncbi:hypothetical protein ABTX60_07135 [Streptomyces sp. NPDC126510]|uniref:hypothetical protein n=1 Tax=Streptomyces sp. NPDC126510 TaxID=3155317 RepID=UPI00332B5D96
MKYRLALTFKTLWAVRAAFPLISFVCALFSGWIREKHFAWAITLVVIAAVAQAVVTLLQLAEQAEPPTELRAVGAGAARLVKKAGAIGSARGVNRETRRREAWQEGLDVLRYKLAPQDDDEVVRASFYLYREASDVFELVRSAGRQSNPAPGTLSGDALVAAKEVMHRNTSSYLRNGRLKTHSLCAVMGAKVLAIGSAVQYQGDRRAAVGVVIVDATSRKHISKPRALGWVSAIALMLAADPIHDQVKLS